MERKWIVCQEPSPVSGSSKTGFFFFFCSSGYEGMVAHSNEKLKQCTCTKIKFKLLLYLCICSLLLMWLIKRIQRYTEKKFNRLKKIKIEKGLYIYFLFLLGTHSYQKENSTLFYHCLIIQGVSTVKALAKGMSC